MIRPWLRAVLVAASVLVSATGAFAQKSYVDDRLASTALRLEATLKTEGQRLAAGRQAAQLRRDADAALASGNARRAADLATAAIAADPNDGLNWLSYALAASGIDPKDFSERYTLFDRATAAAYTAYQRARTKVDEAKALAALAQTYEQRSYWRPALNAYRASLQAADDSAVRATYETLREKHGFRITDFKVDSDASSPRACFEFSEPLALGKIDFAPFVAVSGLANAAVSAEGSQLCVDGLKHGQRYAFVVRQGLPSSVGETLLKSADYEAYVRDRAPMVRFTGRNYVLPRTGQEGLPLISVNTTKVLVDIYRIGDRSIVPTVRTEDFLSQLSTYSARQIETEKGTKIWSGSVATGNELNQDVTTAFPVLEAVKTIEPGIYVMVAKPDSGRLDPPASDDFYDDQSTATQWFVVSDLGLTAMKGADGVHVFVRSLASAKPVPNVEVRLLARNNEVLATKIADATGHVAFDPGLARGEGGMAPGLVVAALADDYGFLDLASSAFDLTDRGVKGRAVSGPVDAFLYTERGVYRSGETVFLTALLRDVKGSAVEKVPLTLVVRRPDGVEYRRVAVEDQGLGGHALPIPILPGAARGTWRVMAYTDPKGAVVGETSFLVEDYVPERLDVTLTPKAKVLRPEEPATIDVSARYLFGAPGADLTVSGEVAVGPASATAVKGLEDYIVGLEDEKIEATSQEIEDTGTTDAKGLATMEVSVPTISEVKPTQARIVLRVAEEGGRAVERSVTLPILPKGPVIGVKKLFKDDLAEGAKATFDVVLATPEGERLSRRGVTWTLSRIERRYQWYNSDGRWGYEPVTTARKESDGRVDLSATAPGRIEAPVQWGTYRLEVRATDLSETAQTSVTFTVGWSGDQTATTPDLLDLSIDKASYKPGETMQVRIAPRYAGTATLAVVSDKVHEIVTLDVAADGTTASLPVKAAWGTGAYLVALTHRPLDQAARRLPGRSLGLAWFALDRAARSIDVALSAPQQMRPRGPMQVPVKLSGLAPNEEARITVAAVDVGILNLTRYEPPKPQDYYFGQKQLSTEIRDLYGFLIDGMQGTRGAIRAGGDGPGLSAEAIPPTQEPLAYYSGIVQVGADGTASVTFDIPPFNGTAKVMAVAWSKEKLGSASADVVIRDPVVMTGTLPRFLAIGDQSRLFLDVNNVELPAGEFTIDIDVQGPVVMAADVLRQKVKLAAAAHGGVSVPITGAGAGLATIDVKISGQGFEGSQRFALRVQPGTSGLVRRTVRPLEAGRSLTVSQDLLTEILPGTGAVSVAVSPLPALDVPGILQALDRYPYGCSEQITSRAMPLLYVNRLASQEALALDDQADERVRGAIERLLARQGGNGSFGLWSVGGDDMWLQAYVTDFLTRARERGFAVPPVAFSLALDRLRNFVVNSSEDGDDKAARAYAIYVLARNGRPIMGDLRYLADTKMGELTSPLARGQIAAALALLGDRTRAQAAFASAVQRLKETQKDAWGYRSDYGSRLRDGAGLLTLASESGIGRDAVQPIAQAVEDERNAYRSTSTQENAWMILAAQAVLKDAEVISLKVDGADHKGAYYRTWKEAALAAQDVTIANTGVATAQVVVNVTGSPVGFEPAISRGYTVERSYYKLDGTQVNPSQVAQNERFVTVLKVTEPQAKEARLLLVDRLPAGFEIDNPKLVDSGSVSALTWLKQDVTPETAEYRDDRFVAAFNRSPSNPAVFTVAYIVRAVSPGKFVHPPALIEDMYVPERFGRTAFGTVEIVPATR